jgi:hypothetical protein
MRRGEIPDGVSMRLRISVVTSVLILWGCAGLKLGPYDSGGTKFLKVLTRITLGVPTLGMSELAIDCSANPGSGSCTGLAVASGALIGAGAGILAAQSGGYGGGCTWVTRTPPGTCSWHGGVAGCSSNAVAVCNDGQMSPGYQPCRTTCE